MNELTDHGADYFADRAIRESLNNFLWAIAMFRTRVTEHVPLLDCLLNNVGAMHYSGRKANPEVLRAIREDPSIAAQIECARETLAWVDKLDALCPRMFEEVRVLEEREAADRAATQPATTDQTEQPTPKPGADS